MGPEQAGVDPKGLKQEQAERYAQAEIERLTNGELTRELVMYRETGITLRKGLSEMVHFAGEQGLMHQRLIEVVEKGGIPDWDAAMPHPDDPRRAGWQAPTIDAQEVLRRAKSQEDAYRFRTGADEAHLQAFLEGLNKLAETYNLHFYLDLRTLIDTLRVFQYQQGPYRWKRKSGEYLHPSPDEYIFLMFDDAVRARLWELTTPEGVPRH